MRENSWALAGERIREVRMPVPWSGYWVDAGDVAGWWIVVVLVFVAWSLIAHPFRDGDVRGWQKLVSDKYRAKGPRGLR